MSAIRTVPMFACRCAFVFLIFVSPVLLQSSSIAWGQQTDEPEPEAPSSEGPAALDETNGGQANGALTESGQTDDAPAQGQDTESATTPDPRIGRRVIVTVDRAPLRTPRQIVWKAYRGEVFTVSLVNGEWLWISSKGGWLWEKETVDFEDAITLLTTTIDSKPTAENYDMRGIAYTAHEKFDEAIQDFSASLKQKRVAGVHNNRGRAYYLKQDYKAAVKDFDAALKMNPKHFVSLLNRALCRMATNKLDAALRDLNKATALNPEFPEALNNRGVIYIRKNDVRRAIADFSLALKIDDGYVEAYGNRAAAQRQLGLFADAKADLETAQTKDPLNYKPVNDLAWFYATVPEAALRDADKAVVLATKACEMTKYEDPNTLDTLAAAYALKGDFKQAQQWILTAIELADAEQRKELAAHKELLEAEKPIIK
ncbi:MAG: tetratricopeptide repeat protein [Planctomycetaceae bacterium]|nr:tetratricopeptide repeat protein [Planctomycetaceae bacterium]